MVFDHLNHSLIFDFKLIFNVFNILEEIAPIPVFTNHLYIEDAPLRVLITPKIETPLKLS